ncbi:tetratricopeptide repeat protein [Sphingorhabdus contaminans]|uniref:Tetratricopeptide repeat protein n=1 Tax=Sphingorhabdus contaminans TaxID=1343899 RepID=A0A553WIX3_9SPHN|nr:tetratricopeptide repeat protein [Sphingorhabdus contaminans]TSB04649.1 tetratricopeptide repeat protein [Sphingorhabdus contaminans]
MGQTIQICKASLGVALLALPVGAQAKTESFADQYVAARVAEIGEQDRLAVQGYLKLQARIPESDILADRLFDASVRAGDMTAAVRAARARSLAKQGTAETALLLFADAWRQRNLDMADLAADELASRGSLAFMSPVLKQWVSIRRGDAPEFAEVDPAVNGVLAYYTTDQRIYFDLATGRLAKAKLGLRSIASQSGDYVRNVLLAGAEVLSGPKDDPAFAQALMRAAVGTSSAMQSVPKSGGRLSPDTGLSAFYGRISAALVEQNQPEEGLVLARIATWLVPESVEMKLALANALQANALQAEALQLLATVPVESPLYYSAFEKRVDYMIAAGQIENVLALTKSELARNPKSVATQLLRARALQAGGNTSEVVAIYSQMTQSDDFATLPPRQQASYRLLLASALDQANNWPAAKIELEKLLIADPNNAQGLNYLGYALLERGGDKTKAFALVRRAYDINPESSAITDSLGWAYYLQGNVTAALPLLEKAAKAAGPDVAINEHLGDVYWTVGRRRDARYAWRIASYGTEGETADRLSRKIDIGLNGRTP